MSYKIEGKDIVISGFEQGIADSPYQGIADMRNMDIIGVPTQASVNFKEVPATVPPVMNAVAYTAQDSGDTITITSTTGLYVGCAIVLAANTANGLTNSVVYYVFNIVGNTFQVRLAAPTGSAIVITSNGTGTLTTYQYGNQRGIFAQAPIAYYVDRSGGAMGPNILIVDGSLYAWTILTIAQGTLPANSLIFLGNIGGIAAQSIPAAGIISWNGYIFIIGGNSSIDIASISTLWATGPAAGWQYAWKTATYQSNNGRVSIISSQEDGNMYFTSSDGVGSLILTPGESFDPSDTDTFILNSDAISLPTNDASTCLVEQKQLILIGGRRQYVYTWNKVSLGFDSIINIPENFTQNIVSASDNAYIFAGTKGRIYITNGSSVDIYKKVPEYVTGSLGPYIRWIDASCSRNQLYFSFRATDNSGTSLDTVNGAWGVDLTTKALRMIVKTSVSGYGGRINMVTEIPSTNLGTPPTPSGTGLVLGWYSTSPTYGVDVPSTAPYDSLEAYIETDMIPVGTLLNPFTPSQIEWKTSYPLGGNGTAETIKISYRKSLAESYSQVGTTTATGTTVVGSTTGTTVGNYVVSDYYTANFENAQWIGLKIEVSSNATTPTYGRLIEIRIRDYFNKK